MGRFKLDGHKLQYHPEHTNKILNNEFSPPIYVEISPASSCNHRCLFCHYNYMGHKGIFPSNRMMSLLDDLAQLNVKSLVFAGVGEPTLNKATIAAIKKAKRLGIDVAMSTNGTQLKEEELVTLARSLSWVRFSLNAGNPENYAHIHNTKASDYNKVLQNIHKLKKIKDSTGSSITIGSQFILLPENKDLVISQAKVMKDIGIDYFVVKHFYQHDKNIYNPDMQFLTKQYIEWLTKEASQISSGNFDFVVRKMENLNRKRIYDKCYGLPLIIFIREDGNVFSCFSYQHDKKTILGNIFKQDIHDILKSDRCKKAITYINNNINKNSCQPNCRHHEINNYLWELKHPSINHVNFI